MLKQWIRVNLVRTTHRDSSRAQRVVRHAGNKDVGGITVHRLPTYNCLRAGRFTNVLLAMMVMILLYKCLQMKAD